MPRSPVVATQPPGITPQTPLTPIPSAAWNSAINDIYNIFNTVQPIDYGGTGGATAIAGHDGLTTKGANVATAATLNLDTATGAFVDLTGTTTVTAVTLSDGRHRMARATGAFQITVGSSLIGNAGGSNINVEAGDLIIFEGYSAGVVRFWVTRASGNSVSQQGGKGYIFGLTLSNNATDAVNDIDIATGECASDGVFPFLIPLSTLLTKRLDAAWSVGTGNGGLDTGSIANTTYHIWMIQRSDTGVVDALFSVSATSPTMPTNYDRKRRIGSILRLSGSILSFSQEGDEFLLSGARLDVNVVNPGTAAVSRTLSVPIGIKVKALLNYSLANGGGAVFPVMLLSSLDRLDQTPSQSNAPLATAGIVGNATGATNYTSGETEVRTNTSGQIRSRLDASDASVTLRVSTYGWIDWRGRM